LKKVKIFKKENYFYFYFSLILVLSDMNSIIRFDMNLKKLFTTLNIEKFEIVNFLLSLLGEYDIQMDNLILLNISNFLKEIDYCKKHSNQELFENIFSYLASINFDFYKILIANSNDSSYFDKIKNELTNFILIINILSSLFSHSVEKSFDIDMVHKLSELIFSIFVKITDQKSVKEKITENKSNKNIQFLSESYFTYLKDFETITINSIINILNILYFSKNTDVDLIFSINNFIISNFENLSHFITKKQQGDLILVKNIIIYFQDLLRSIYNTKLEYLPENTQQFFKSYSNFIQEIINMEVYNKEIKTFFFTEKTFEILKLLEEKYYIANSQVKNE
jgi:hypothetical protein